jgi:transcriptional regulator with XRE-family HTH domain
MADGKDTELGKALKAKRLELGLSISEVGRRAEIQDTTVMRLEQGLRIAPSPDILSRLAKVLDLPLSELYTLTGYPLPNDLPNMSAYLRTKYPKMPARAKKDLDTYLGKLKDKYGLDETGPTNGEDEN